MNKVTVLNPSEVGVSGKTSFIFWRNLHNWLDIFLLLYGRKWWSHGSWRSWKGGGWGARIDWTDVERDDAGDGVHLQV